MYYFLTEQDPNYTIKGSRDPLGFQVIWQNAGKKIIPHLSTVSSNVTDFQILCIAHYLKQKLEIVDFEPFFMRLEQFFAYSRFLKENQGFNGIDKVRREMNNKGAATDFRLLLSNTKERQILSNQRAYGIWGKYSRPFNDMGLGSGENIMGIFERKFNGKETFFKKFVKDVRISKLELLDFQHLLEKPEGAEKRLLTQKLLSDHFHGELLRICQIHSEEIKDSDSIFQIISFFEERTLDPNLKQTLSYIKNLEMVLCPLNRIFRHLQQQSIWTKKEIENESSFKIEIPTISTIGFDEVHNQLNATLHCEPWDLVKGLARRNSEVSEKRGSAPWIRTEGESIEVSHFDGAYPISDYTPGYTYDNSYFLKTFLSLYKQLN